MSSTVEEVAKQLKALTPSQRLKALRLGDHKAKALLIQNGMERGAWTMGEVAEWLEEDISNISRLVSTYGKK